ncbi:MAG TPA: M1 family metallopeptidase [Chitinophagales bacterium]|nr:M1 family metallopeptidase [Chitinophagales bacterium]
MTFQTTILKIFIFLSILYCIPLQAQNKKKRQRKADVITENVFLDTLDIYPVNKILDYKGTSPKYFNLIHTQLYLTPSFKEKSIHGTAILKLTPHFYDQSELVLDAKGMSFDSISLSLDNFSSLVDYAYDGMKLRIQLSQAMTKKDTFEVKIQYTTHTHQLNDLQKSLGQGAYFINNNQYNPYRSTILWTQGETEAAACWFPTIDATYQKTTQEIYVTVPDSLTTISNGTLVSQMAIENGLRTDYWRQTQAHAPYLFALVVGPYIKVEDSWRDQPVDYYTLAPYDQVIREVFGRTPEMIDFFSKKFQYDFPWDNYKQATVYDFVAGAMENTTLSIFHEGLMCNHGDILDKNFGEDGIIAHELVHQWFGDLVTCESWSELTLNESFASYGEYLWAENWKGKDDAASLWRNKYLAYLREYTYKKADPLVQNYYDTPQEVFDRHRYDKGAIVLHLLRQYIGDEAFFDGIGEYLNKNAFQSTEVAQLRLAFEKITGLDLNWFFNQWYFEPGHPVVDLKYRYDSVHQEVVIDIYQKQDQHPNVEVPYHKILFNVDLIYSDTIIQQKITINNKQESIRFASTTPPLTVNFDPGKMQVWEADMDYKSEDLAMIYHRSNQVLDKVFVIDQFKENLNFEQAAEILLPDFENQHWLVQENILKLAAQFNLENQKTLTDKCKDLLLSERPSSRRNALEALKLMKDAQIIEIAQSILENDSSNMLKSVALDILFQQLKADAYPFAIKFLDIKHPQLEVVIAKILAAHPQKEDIDYFKKSIFSIIHYLTKPVIESFGKYLIAMDDNTFEQGMDALQLVIENAYGNGRVTNAKNLIRDFQNLKVGKDGWTATKKEIVNQYAHLIN